jgi:hypothetical protein
MRPIRPNVIVLFQFDKAHRRSLDEWKSLGATEQAIEDAAIDRSVAADPAGRAS